MQSDSKREDFMLVIAYACIELVYIIGIIGPKEAN